MSVVAMKDTNLATQERIDMDARTDQRVDPDREAAFKHAQRWRSTREHVCGVCGSRTDPWKRLAVRRWGVAGPRFVCLAKEEKPDLHDDLEYAMKRLEDLKDQRHLLSKAHLREIAGEIALLRQNL